VYLIDIWGGGGGKQNRFEIKYFLFHKKSKTYFICSLDDTVLILRVGILFSQVMMCIIRHLRNTKKYIENKILCMVALKN
jgi:hypothetical protein